MIKKIIIMLGLCLIPLIAQEDFLVGVKAEDLMLDKIEAVPAEIIREIEDRDDYWCIPPAYSLTVYSLDSTLIAEVRLDVKSRPIGLWLKNLKMDTEKMIVDGLIEDLKWSPSGKYLSFIKLEYVANPADDKLPRKPFFNTDRLCLYDNQIGEIKNIVSTGGLSTEHSWAPFDNYLAYSYRDKGKYILAIYNAENNKNTIVDELIYCDLWNFSWSPNGRMLAYTKPLKMDRYINEEAPIESEVFVVNYDGTGKKQITNTPESEVYVKWLSNGSRIITEVVIDPEEYTWGYHYLVLKK